MAAMKEQFLYFVRPTRLAMLTEGPTEEEMAALMGHVAYFDRLVAEGQVIVYGRTQNNDEKTMGIAIFEANDAAEAQQLLEADPAVAQGVFAGEVLPYKIAGMRKA
jgi:uncharacterized protein YciI